MRGVQEGGRGIIDCIGGNCWETAWKSAGGQLSFCAATLRITFHLLSALLSDSREACPDQPPNMCVPVPSWPTPLISASIESEQMALWPGSPSPYTIIIGQERMMRLAQTLEG